MHLVNISIDNVHYQSRKKRTQHKIILTKHFTLPLHTFENCQPSYVALKKWTYLLDKSIFDIFLCQILNTLVKLLQHFLTHFILYL